jgi:hypothetical protein
MHVSGAHRPLLRRVAFATALLLAACDSPTAVEAVLPNGAVLRTAPAVYQRWWRMTTACANATARFEDIRWYYVDGASVLDPSGTSVFGYHEPEFGRVVLAGSSAYFGSEVRHVMLHVITRSARHDRDTFLAQCAGVVDCDARCVRDAGPAPSVPADVVRISPDALSIGVTLSRASVSRRAGDDFFEQVVTATNPFNHEVLVNLPPSGDAGPSPSFEYSLSSEPPGTTHWYTQRAWDISAARFAPGETKRWIFDVSAAWLEAGDFVATGRYGDVTAPERPVISILP